MGIKKNLRLGGGGKLKKAGRAEEQRVTSTEGEGTKKKDVKTNRNR